MNHPRMSQAAPLQAWQTANLAAPGATPHNAGLRSVNPQEPA